MTVSGPMEPGLMGATLMHEHVLIDLTRVLAPPGATEERRLYELPLDPENRADIGWSPAGFQSAANSRPLEVDQLVEELRDLALAGGSTIVDLTPIGLRRQVHRFPELEARSGVRIVAGTAYFVAAHMSTEALSMTVEEMAATLIGEFEDGIEGTSVRPGIIGEVGTSAPLAAAEERSLRAAAVAARATGMSIVVHLDRWAREGHRVVDVLESAGADPSRVVIGHLNTTADDPGYHLGLARRGVMLGYDLCGSEMPRAPGHFPLRDLPVVESVARLVGSGHGHQVVLSSDVSFRTELRTYGGRGYAHVLRRVVPLLREAGIAEDAVSMMIRETPARLLTLAHLQRGAPS